MLVIMVEIIVKSTMYVDGQKFPLQRCSDDREKVYLDIFRLNHLIRHSITKDLSFHENHWLGLFILEFFVITPLNSKFLEILKSLNMIMHLEKIL